MQIQRTDKSPTEVSLDISASPAELTAIKDRVVKRLSRDVVLPGFRKGKAPKAVIEKSLDPQRVNADFIDEVLNDLYSKALDQEKLRPVSQPEVELKKFVPYDTLEFSVSIDVLGPIKLGDFKAIKKTMPKATVNADDVEEVLKTLRIRMADRKDVKRAAKDGDQVWIDFKGTDEAGKAIAGAEGKDYPLVLGSNTFIKGFEPELIGHKAGDEKTFTVTFPEDYGAIALQNKKVTFNVKVNKIQEVVEPKMDDAFAKQVGPFENLEDLKNDIRQQLELERTTEARRKIENDIVEELVEKSSVTIPEGMIDTQSERSLEEEKRRLAVRGQTWEDHLTEEGMDEATHLKERIRPEAEKRIKTGLILSQVADEENIDVAQEELTLRLQQLKLQYHDDQQMQAELDNPANHQDVAARILTEKTLDKLMEYATK